MFTHVASALLVNRVTPTPSVQGPKRAKWLTAAQPRSWSSLPEIMHNEVLVDVRAQTYVCS